MPTLRDLMTEDPVALEPEMSLRDAIERLTGEGISGAPVVAGQRLVGVVSATDITLIGIVSTMDFVRAVAEGRLRSPE